MTGIVTARARTGFDYFVAQAAKNALASDDTECTVSSVDDSPSTARDVVMFTVSSYTFRVLLFLHFESNDVTRAHFAKLVDKSDDMGDARFLDTVMERGNLFCGALNRDLAQYFPHIGMSTPCVLHHGAVEHIGSIKPAFTRRYGATVSTDLTLHLTLAVCAFADLDFAFDERAVMVTDSAGELEMF